MLLDRFGQSKKEVFGTSNFECFEGPLENVLKTSWRRPELTCQGRPLNVRLGCPLYMILGRPQNVRSQSPGTSDWDVSEMVK